MTALVCAPAFVFAAVAGMRSADPASRELFASVDASRWQVLWRLRLPSALPSLFTTARYNTGLALVVAYLVEGGNLADEGLGAIGRRAANNSVGEAVWATVFCMVVIGTLALIVIGALERWVLHWHASQRSTAAARTAS
jgi:NitT/TauT family transport system permease protein